MHRRSFLAAGLAASALRAEVPAKVSPGKDAALAVVSTDPLVLETPDRLLAASRVTPASALFVRNHHGAKAFEGLAPRPITGTLEIGGLVKAPKRMALTRLATLDRVEVEMVLQCSGNFRALFSKLSPIKGTPWNKGGVGNVKFAGVPLAAAFKAAGVVIDPRAKFLTAAGEDMPEKDSQADYEKSVPLAVALDRAILAFEMNAKPLPAVHGGPLRLVIPGYYGTNQVKWLNRLRLDAVETSNLFQLPDYRTPKRLIKPGDKIEYTFDNSDSNFDMKIQSRLLSLADGDKVPAGKALAVKGVAWNDGTAALVSVEVSADDGKTWRSAELAASAGAFAFREWSAAVTLTAGKREIWVRATDAAGRCQVADGGIFWNPGGYAWAGYEKVTVVAG